MDGGDQIIPRARERGLIVRELDEETIVYELETDRAHCLDPISATVWKHCDGRTTVTELVDILRQTQQAPLAEDAVWQAILQLAQYDLLEEQVSRPARTSMSRREWMKRNGLTAAVAFPFITSLAVPSAAMAASTCGRSSERGNGCPCTKGWQCSSFCCVSGACQAPSSVGKSADSQTCRGHGNCCSHNCVVTAGGASGICMSE